MKWKSKLIILIAILTIALVAAYDFDPGRDINLRDLYDIKNVVDGDFACLNLSGDYRCAWATDPNGTAEHNTLNDIQGGTETERYHVNESIYNKLVSFVFSWITGDYFDQGLNTTDDVTFRNMTISNITADYYFGDGSLLTGITLNYYPSDVNLTSGTYNGSIINGSKTGYNAGNAICDAEFSGSHMCNEFEILDWFANEDSPSVTGDAWCSTGAPKYIPATIPVNDCHGWTYDGTTSYLGNYWHFNTTTGGDGRAINCGTTLKLACCTY